MGINFEDVMPAAASTKAKAPQEVEGGQPLTGFAVNFEDALPVKEPEEPGILSTLAGRAKTAGKSFLEHPLDTTEGFVQQGIEGATELGLSAIGGVGAGVGAAAGAGKGKTFGERYTDLYGRYQAHNEEGRKVLESYDDFALDHTPNEAKEAGAQLWDVFGDAQKSAGESAYQNTNKVAPGAAPLAGAAAETATAAAMLLGSKGIARMIPKGTPRGPTMKGAAPGAPRGPGGGGLDGELLPAQQLRGPPRGPEPVAPKQLTQADAEFPVDRAIEGPQKQLPAPPRAVIRAEDTSSSAPEISSGRNHSIWKNSSDFVVENIPPGGRLRAPASLILSRMVNTGDARVQPMLKRIQELTKDVQVRFKPGVVDEKGRPAHGLYWHNQHMIEVDSNLANQPGYMTGVVVHELAHAATSRYIVDNPKSQITQKLNALYLEALSAAQKLQRTRRVNYKGQYGLTNLEEFVSETLSNTTFQRYLAVAEHYGSSPAMREARGKAFLDPDVAPAFSGIQELFGIKNPKYPSKLLKDVLNTVEMIFTAQSKTGANRAKEMNWKDQSSPDLVKGPDQMQKGPGKQEVIKLPSKGKLSNKQIEDGWEDEHSMIADALKIDPVNLETEPVDAATAKQFHADGWKIYGFDSSTNELVRVRPELIDKDRFESLTAVKTVNPGSDRMEQARRSRKNMKANDDFQDRKKLEGIRNKILAERDAKEDAVKVSDAIKSVIDTSTAADTARNKWGLAPDDPVIYMHAGIPIRKSDIQAAFTLGKKAAEKIPGFIEAEQMVGVWWEQMIRTVSPEVLGPEAKSAAATVAKGLANEARKTGQYIHRSKDRRVFWQQRSAEVADFIGKFERGIPFADPLMQQAADAYRAWNDEIYAQDMRTGFKYDARDNYLAHIFEDQAAVTAFFNRKYGGKWGDPGFIKDRGFDLYSQAIAAGFKPKYTNPEDIMLARQHASDIAQMRTEILEEMERNGIAVKKLNAAGKPIEQPEGFDTSWTAPTGTTYWVQNNANAVLHNAFNTPSLWGKKGFVGDGFRGMMWLKNSIVPIQLGLSLFHPLHVLTIHNVTGLTRMTEGLMAGKIGGVEWMKELARGQLYLDLVSAPREGYNILKAVQGRVKDSDLTAADRRSLMLMAEGGFIPTMSEVYKNSAIQKFRDAMNEGRKTNAAWWLLWTPMELMQKPMFEVWIPSLKIASYLRDADMALRMNPELMLDQNKRQITLRQIAKSVDNRYGEMAYSTLFWNKTVKDMGVGGLLSLGWQLGFMREYGGAAIDAGQFVGRDTAKIQQIKEGKLHRPLFVLFYTAQAMLYGALITKMVSGDDPQELKDLVLPKIGKDANGEDQRISTMFYPTEFYKIGKHLEHEGTFGGITKTVANKASPSINLVKAWATNVDGLNREISDPEGAYVKRLGEKLSYTMGLLKPMSFQNLDTPGDVTRGLLGFGKAPRYATEGATEGHIRSTYEKYYSPAKQSYAQAKISKARGELKRLYLKGDMNSYQEKFAEVSQDMTPGEVKRLEKYITSTNTTDSIMRMWKRLSWDQQKKILDKMPEEEKEKYLSQANKEHARRYREEMASGQ